MSAGNTFLNGEELLSLTPQNVLVKDWTVTLTGDQPASCRNFANECFAYYYTTCRRIACHPPKLASVMLSALKNCAFYRDQSWFSPEAWAEWMFGYPVKTLAEGFSHYLQTAAGHKTPYTWTDNHVSDYYRGAYSPFSKNSVTTLTCCMNFAQAVDTVYAYVQGQLTVFQKACVAMDLTNSAQTFLTVKEVANNLQPYLWYAPPEVIPVAANYIPDGGKYYGESVRKGITYLDWLDKFKTLGDTLNTYVAGGYSVTQGTAAGISTVLLGMIPVFGQFYAGVIAVLPSLLDWAKTVTNQKVECLAKIYGRQAGEIFPGWAGNH